MTADIIRILEDARAASTLPGAVVCYGDEGRYERVASGTQAYDPGNGDMGEVARDTIYDIASLTKPVATVATAMRLVEQGVVTLDTRAAALVSGVPGDVTLAHLLGHCAGFPAHVELFRAHSSREELFRAAAHTPPERRPGVTSVYSDIGFLILGAALEAAAGRRLDELVAELVTTPLCMADTTFVDSSTGAVHPQLERVAPTEWCPWRGRLVRGQVHDENAFAAGGVCGHAGLFSTADDLARFARAILAAWSGDDGGPFAPEVVGAFLDAEACPGSSWRLGWDTPSSTPGVSHAGDRWPREGAVGHLAFTGCSLWLSRAERAFAVILSNRVHPTRDRSGIRDVRRALMDAIAADLGLAGKGLGEPKR